MSDELTNNETTSKLNRTARWLKPFVVLMALLFFFAGSNQFSLEMTNQSLETSSVENVDANIFGDAMESLGRWGSRKLDGLFDNQEAATEITSGDFDGSEWSIVHPDASSGGEDEGTYNGSSSGAVGGNGEGNGSPFDDVGDLSESDAAPFMAFQHWASTYGVYSGYEGVAAGISQIIPTLGRWAGGSVMQVTAYIGRIVQLVGTMVYQAVDTLNIFSYIVPDYTEGSSLMSEWHYRGGEEALYNEGGIFNYFAQWLNTGRYVGYVMAMVLFVAGLALTVLGVRIGKSQTMSGSFLSTINRLLVSVFALTGAILMLSSIISTFADAISAEGDSFDIDHQIAGLILDYEGFVTVNYDSGDSDMNSQWHVNAGYENNGSTGSDSLSDAIDVYTGAASYSTIPENGTLSADEIRSMNEEAGSYYEDYLDDPSEMGAFDYIREFTNFPAAKLLAGWSSNSVTHSSDMATRYGEESMPYAIYRVNTDGDGMMKVENGSLFSRDMTYYDYTLPGGFAGVARYFGVLGSILLVSAFALRMYWYILQSIFGMIKRSIVYLPTAIGLGSLSSLFILFGAVITMIVQIVFARMMISLFKNILNSSWQIFPVLTEFMGSDTSFVASSVGGLDLFNFGSILPFGAIEPSGQVIVIAIATWVIGALLFSALGTFNTKMGSSIEGFFSDMAMRIAGIRKEGPQGNGSSADGSVESTTVSETDGSSSIGSFSENEAAELGLGGNIIGGVGAGGGLGAAQSGQYSADGFGTDSEDDVDQLSDDGLSSESVLSRSPNSADSLEEGLGVVGSDGSSDSMGADGTEEEETTLSESTASGSSASGSSLGDNSAVSDMRDEEMLDDSNADAMDSSEMGDEAMDSERTISGTDRVVSDMEQEFEEMDDGDNFEGSMNDGEAMSDSERTVGGTDNVRLASDEVVDDEMDARDTLAEQQQMSDQNLQGADATISASEGNVDVVSDDTSSAMADYGQSDESFANGALGADASTQDIDAEGSDANVRYNTADDDTSMIAENGALASSNGYDVDDMSEDGSAEDGALARTVDGEDASVDVNTDVMDGERSMVEDGVSEQGADNQSSNIAAYDLADVSDNSDASLNDMTDEQVRENNEESLSRTVASTVEDQYNVSNDGAISQEQSIQEGASSVTSDAASNTAYNADPSTNRQDVDEMSVSDEVLDESTQQTVVGDISGVSEDEVRMDQTGDMTHHTHLQEGSDQLQENQSATNTYDQSVTPVSNPDEVQVSDQSIDESSQVRNVSNVDAQYDQSSIVDTDGQVEQNQSVEQGASSISNAGQMTANASSGDGYNLSATAPTNDNVSKDSSPTVTESSDVAYGSGSLRKETGRSGSVGQHDYNNKTTTTSKYTPSASADGNGESQSPVSSSLSSDFDRMTRTNGTAQSQNNSAAGQQRAPRVQESVAPADTSVRSDFSSQSQSSSSAASDRSTIGQQDAGSSTYDIGTPSSTESPIQSGPSTYETSDSSVVSNRVASSSGAATRTTDTSTKKGSFGRRQRPQRTVENATYDVSSEGSSASSDRELTGTVTDSAKEGLFGQRTGQTVDRTASENVTGTSSYDRETTKAPRFGRRD